MRSTDRPAPSRTAGNLSPRTVSSTLATEPPYPDAPLGAFQVASEEPSEAPPESAEVQLASPAPVDTGPSPPAAGPAEVGLSEEKYRIAVRLLLHIARQPPIEPRGTVSAALTQAGMAAALGTSQAAVSYALKRLVEGGALKVELSHVRHQLRRLRVYQLTSLGEDLVRHVRDGMGK
jgi:DNA-binding transcriptional ArsR family regulator